MNNETNEHDYGDYVIYGDETGDRCLQIVYEQHPVFALILCIFPKNAYIDHAVRNVKKLKFDFWGHDSIILHSAKLRRQTEAFQFLQNVTRREIFYERINNVIKLSPFTIISTCIDKRLLKQRYTKPEDPYELSLEYCLERVYRFLQEKKQINKITHIILESRGSEVDHTLEIAFNRIIAKNETWQAQYPLKVLFVDKKSNNVGLQIADLVAYPIGRFVVDPCKENLSFNVFRDKFHYYPNHLGKGLKIFPEKISRNEPEKRKASEYSEA